MTSGGNNFNYFPENQLTKFMYFPDSGCVRTLLRTLCVYAIDDDGITRLRTRIYKTPEPFRTTLTVTSDATGPPPAPLISSLKRPQHVARRGDVTFEWTFSCKKSVCVRKLISPLIFGYWNCYRMCVVKRTYSPQAVLRWDRGDVPRTCPQIHLLPPDSEASWIYVGLYGVHVFFTFGETAVLWSQARNCGTKLTASRLISGKPTLTLNSLSSC